MAIPYKKPPQHQKKATVSKEMNFDALLDAIKDNLLKKKAIRAAARKYGVDRITLPIM